MTRVPPPVTAALKRPLVQDALVAVALAALSLVSMWTPPAFVDYDFRDPDALGVALAVTGAASVAVRSRYPLLALAVALATTLPMLQLGYNQTIGGLAALLALYSVAANRRLETSLAAGGVTVLSIGVVLMTGPLEPTLGDWIANALVLVTGWSFGRTVRSRRARLASSQARDDALATAEQAEQQAAAIRDRARVAQELQDLVAHSLTEITVQMNAARLLIDQNPGLAKQTLADAETGGRAATQEMRRLFALMAEPTAAAQLRPAPDLSTISDLVESHRVGGTDVAVTIEGQPRELGPGAALTAYRIVEEALHNARRHALAHHVEVHLDWSSDDLTLTVTDDGARAAIHWSEGQPPQQGALARLRERAAIYGAELTWGRRPAGGFTVTTRLPLNETGSTP